MQERIGGLPVECEHCGIATTRGELVEHNKSCPQRPRTCCAAQAGCAWRGFINELVDHEATCVHVACQDAVAPLAAENKELAAINDHLQAQIATLQPLQAHVAALQPLQARVAALEPLREENASLRERLLMLEEGRDLHASADEGGGFQLATAHPITPTSASSSLQSSRLAEDGDPQEGTLWAPWLSGSSWWEMVAKTCPLSCWHPAVGYAGSNSNCRFAVLPPNAPPLSGSSRHVSPEVLPDPQTVEKPSGADVQLMSELGTVATLLAWVGDATLAAACCRRLVHLCLSVSSNREVLSPPVTLPPNCWPPFLSPDSAPPFLAPSRLWRVPVGSRAWLRRCVATHTTSTCTSAPAERYTTSYSAATHLGWPASSAPLTRAPSRRWW